MTQQTLQYSPATVAWRVVNPRTLMMSVGAVAAGSATDLLRGNFELLPGTLCLLFAVLAQASGNATHHYFDSLRRACPNSHHNDETARLMLARIGQALGIMGAGVGVALLSMTGWWGLGFATVIVLIEWLANCGRRPLMTTPWGALVTFMLFGPVCVLGTAMAQSEYEATVPFSSYDLVPALFMAAVMGLQAVEIHLLISYFNRSYARRHQGHTFAAAFGRHATLGTMCACATLCVLTMVAMCIITPGVDNHSAQVWLSFLPVPLACLAVNIWIILRMPHARHEEQRRLRTLAEAKMAFCGLATFFAFWFIAAADNSTFRYF